VTRDHALIGLGGIGAAEDGLDFLVVLLAWLCCGGAGAGGLR